MAKITVTFDTDDDAQTDGLLYSVGSEAILAQISTDDMRTLAMASVRLLALDLAKADTPQAHDAPTPGNPVDGILKLGNDPADTARRLRELPDLSKRTDADDLAKQLHENERGKSAYPRDPETFFVVDWHTDGPRTRHIKMTVVPREADAGK